MEQPQGAAMPGSTNGEAGDPRTPDGELGRWLELTGWFDIDNRSRILEQDRNARRLELRNQAFAERARQHAAQLQRAESELQDSLKNLFVARGAGAASSPVAQAPAPQRKRPLGSDEKHDLARKVMKLSGEGTEGPRTASGIRAARGAHEITAQGPGETLSRTNSEVQNTKTADTLHSTGELKKGR